MGNKAVIGKLADAVGIPSGITQVALNPMGAALDAIGAPKWAQTAIGLATNPAGTAIGLAKDYGKEKLMEAVRNAPSVPGGGEEGGRGEGSSVNQGFELRRRGFGQDEDGFKRGGKVKAKAKVSSASKRADGIAQRGKTKGRYI